MNEKDLEDFAKAISENCRHIHFFYDITIRYTEREKIAYIFTEEPEIIQKIADNTNNPHHFMVKVKKSDGIFLLSSVD